MRIRRSSLPLKSGLFALTAVVLMSIAIIVVFEHFLKKRYLTNQYETMDTLAREIGVTNVQQSKDVQSDVRFLASLPPIQGIIRARQNNGIDPRDDDSELVWQARLEQIFSSFILARPNYSQVRYIGLADDGKEIVRVDRVENGVDILRGSDLQKKAHRDYVTRASQMTEGEVYISTINLNREHGVIAEPFEATRRYATPIYDKNGVVFGLVVINVDVAKRLARINEISSELFDADEALALVVNKQGYYLFHPDNKKTFGFEFARDDRWYGDFTSLDKTLATSEDAFLSGKTVYPISQGIYHTAYFPLDNDELKDAELGLIFAVPPLSSKDIFSSSRFLVIVFSITIVAICLVLFFALFYKQSRALRRLADSANEIAEGDYQVNIPTFSDDAMTSLAEGFRHLQDSVRERESRLRRSEQRARHILNSIPMGILLIDSGGVIRNSNKAACELLEYADNEFSEVRGFETLFGPEFDKVFEKIRELIEIDMAPTRLYEFSATTKQGKSFNAEVSFSSVDYNGRRYILTTFSDITDRKKAQEKLLEYRSKLEETIKLREQELKAKGEFMANMSHEIRTPMTAILGLLDIVRGTDLSEKQRQYVYQIYESSRALLTIINDILDLSKIEAGKIELVKAPFSLLRVSENVTDLFSPSAELKGVETFLNYDPKITNQVIGDGPRLTQVLSNLVGNAVKFTSEGEIVLGVEALEFGESYLRVRFYITDTGIGMEPATLDRLFEAFEQADSATTRVYGGSGLGLTISSNLIELMGGKLEAETEIGVGSRFWFDLEFEISTQPELTAGLAKDLNRRVLVVDDQTTSCEVLTEMLCHWGCEVVTADNAAEGLMSFKTAAEEGYPFSIVITDTHVAGMDGYELATKIAEFSASIGLIIDTPVLMVGEIQRSELFSNAREITGVELLNKPVTMSKLLNTLSNLGVISMVKDERDSRDWKDLEDILQSELEATNRRARILLVEDNETNQMVVKELLSKFALDIECAENGLVGVEKVRQNEYDLVLMDLQMPKMDGFQATEAIREIKSKDELPILALSAASFMEDINKAILSGMNEHLMKPIDISQLYRALIKWLFPSTTNGFGNGVAAKENNTGTEATKMDGRLDRSSLLAHIRSDPNFDLSVTLISVLGEQGFMRLIETFAKEFEGVLAEWRQSPSWDAEKKRLIAHSIKGASQSIGAVVLKQLAETVELALKGGRDVNFSALMKMLEETLETLSA